MSAVGELQAHVSHVGRFALPPGRLHCHARHSGARSGRTSLSGVPVRRDVGVGRAARCVGGPTRAKLAMGCNSVPRPPADQRLARARDVFFQYVVSFLVLDNVFAR